MNVCGFQNSSENDFFQWPLTTIIKNLKDLLSIELFHLLIGLNAHLPIFLTYFILCNLGNILKLNIASQPNYQALEALQHSRGFLGLILLVR